MDMKSTPPRSPAGSFPEHEHKAQHGEQQQAAQEGRKERYAQQGVDRIIKQAKHGLEKSYHTYLQRKRGHRLPGACALFRWLAGRALHAAENPDSHPKQASGGKHGEQRVTGDEGKNVTNQRGDGSSTTKQSGQTSCSLQNTSLQ